MFIRRKTIKGNPYFYLVENVRVDTRPVQKVIAYLGTKNRAISQLESSSYPEKDNLLSQVKAIELTTGPNKGKRGRPRKVAQLQQVAEPVSAEATEQRQTSKKILVLVIEDEAFIREMLQESLYEKGFDAIGARNGRVGVQMAKEKLPNLILCDITMPELTGYGVLAALRQDPITAMIPFIFLTAKDNKEDIRQGMELGADDYITKPFTIEELIRSINSRLEKQSALEQWYAAKFQLAPEQPFTNTAVSSADTKSIFPLVPHLREVFNFIEANYHQPITLGAVAKAVGYSPAYLTDLVGRQTGKTVIRWIIERRMVEARSLLLQTDLSVEQIAAALGYLDTGYFHRQFRENHNMTPQVWRNKHSS